jgi:DNA-binding beta-propeller fold protein YncE
MIHLARIIWIPVVLAACADIPPSSGDAGTGSDAGTDGGTDGSNSDYDVPFTSGTSTVAGGPDTGWADGPRKQARFWNPVNVAYRDGRLYVADFDNNKIRVIDLESFATSTLVAQQGFERPFGLAFAPDGTLYVSTDNDENGKHSLMTGAIWRIAPGSRSATLIVSGIGRPRGLAVLPDGRLAAADYVHHVVEIVDPSTGIVSPLAGTWDASGMTDGRGAQARFAAPYGIAVTSDGVLVVADYDNHALRLLTPDGITTTLTGSGARGFRDGDVDTAMFQRPQAVAITANGDIYVADSDNFRIRRIVEATVQTIAGDGTAGYRDSDDPLKSRLYGLEGLAVVPDGSMVYVADGSRGEDLPFHRIRQVAKHW